MYGQENIGYYYNNARLEEYFAKYSDEARLEYARTALERYRSYRLEKMNARQQIAFEEAERSTILMSSGGVIGPVTFGGAMNSMESRFFNSVLARDDNTIESLKGDIEYLSFKMSCLELSVSLLDDNGLPYKDLDKFLEKHSYNRTFGINEYSSLLRTVYFVGEKKDINKIARELDINDQKLRRRISSATKYIYLPEEIFDDIFDGY